MNKVAYYILYNMLKEKQQNTIQSKMLASSIKTAQLTAIPYDEQVTADDLLVPWAMDMSKDGRIYFTERPGFIRVIESGVLRETPVFSLRLPFVEVGEGGLMGLVLDPDYLDNHYIYIMYTYEDGGQIFNRVARIVERENEASYDRIIVDRIPGGRVNNGGRIKIGPDGKLYITTGDAGNGALAQDLNSLAGKILRVNLDGTIPEDNPFPDSPVYSYGHRNPQGLTWGPNGILYSSEHGQSGYDEINIIIPGGNYGWPIVRGLERVVSDEFVRPILNSGDTTWAPAGMAYIADGPWAGKILVANLRGRQMLSLTLDDDGTSVSNLEILFKDTYGRLRDVMYTDTGSIYFSTSNTDGRGTPQPGDDMIIHLIPHDVVQVERK